MKASLIVLSGGRSSRMGRNKALLPVGSKTSIQRIIDRLQPSTNETILVTNDPEEYRMLSGAAKIVKDIYPGLGPLAGIHAGLQASGESTNLVVACDMPFASASLATYLIQQSKGYDALIPRAAGKNQPLFAVYQRSCLSPLEECLKANLLSVGHFLSRVHVRYLEERELPTGIHAKRDFFNMNDPEEYQQVLEWTDQEKGQDKGNT